MYPSFANLDITQYNLTGGFYTLGMMKQFRPDIEFIPIRHKLFNVPMVSHSEQNYDWLRQQIEQALAQGRTVGLLPEDEMTLFDVNHELVSIVNDFANQPVYWITQCDTMAQDSYRTMHGFRCKMLEIPWYLLNDVLCYYRVRKPVTANAKTGQHFLCMVNNQAQHKMDLLLELHQRALNQIGTLTLSKQPGPVPTTPGFEFCEVNPFYPYNVPTGANIIGGCELIDGVWVSKNVENYLYIEQTYNHIPLIVSPETTIIQYKSTEKSIWPALLGHLFLIYGRPGTMAWIQKFYDIDIATYANLEFDNPGPPAHRLSKMLDKNLDLFRHAPDIQAAMAKHIADARWSFGQRMYAFFLRQLDAVQ